MSAFRRCWQGGSKRKDDFALDPETSRNIWRSQVHLQRKIETPYTRGVDIGGKSPPRLESKCNISERDQVAWGGIQRHRLQEARSIHAKTEVGNAKFETGK